MSTRRPMLSTTRKANDVRFLKLRRSIDRTAMRTGGSNNSKPDGAGDEPRHDQQEAGEQQQEAVDHFLVRDAPGLEGGVQATEHREPGSLHQPDAEHRHEHEQRDGVEHADMHRDLHHDPQLGDEQHKQREHERILPRTTVSPMGPDDLPYSGRSRNRIRRALPDTALGLAGGAVPHEHRRGLQRRGALRVLRVPPRADDQQGRDVLP